MSIVKDLKNAETKIESLMADLAGRDARIAELTAELENVVATVGEKDKALETTAAELNAKAEKAIADMQERDEKITAMETERAEIEAQLESLKAAVAQDTALAHAAAGTQPVPDGGEGGEVKTKAQLESEYAAIKGADHRETARLKQEFRNQYRKELGL